MLDLLLESALPSLVLGVAVWLGVAFLRVRNPRAHMTAWTYEFAPFRAVTVAREGSPEGRIARHGRV
jgi:hypothetical protein